MKKVWGHPLWNQTVSPQIVDRSASAEQPVPCLMLEQHPEKPSRGRHGPHWYHNFQLRSTSSSQPRTVEVLLHSLYPLLFFPRTHADPHSGLQWCSSLYWLWFCSLLCLWLHFKQLFKFPHFYFVSFFKISTRFFLPLYFTLFSMFLSLKSSLTKGPLRCLGSVFFSSSPH